ncbi:protoporphyrinogen oxidase [Allorhizocola rhizosphaerae]|uniref:protoporphyrinogen oxidase n=1 Tax=Allorhizocola rhizosphaerae TaxID=1872709 RepID=UPI003CCC50CA
MGSMREVTVVGGGMAGLSAALRLAEAGAAVTLREGSGRLGGKLRTEHGLEAGAENFLMRDPGGGPSAAVLLCELLGLADDIVHPTGLPAGLLIKGGLKPLPRGTFLGIPGPETDLEGVAALGGSDVDTGQPVVGADDVSVGEVVRARMGDDVVDKLVDPLLGGVYAGRADGLSLEATMPGLFKLLQTEHTLAEAVRRGVRPSTGEPVFGTVVGGLSRLIEAATTRLADLGAQIHLLEPVRALPDGPVVLAVPGAKAARLLDGHPPLEYASVALVTMELPPVELPELSGFLVPESEDLSIKAATFFSRKWPHVKDTMVRLSLGRAGDPVVLQAPDDVLVELARRDLSKVVGALPAPLAARVDRWGGGLPQYEPGHVRRVAQFRASLRDRPIALAGAAYDGVGIPACVKSGWQAADLLLERWMA